MSTLPRTKSLGGADSSTLPARRKLKARPSSFCESTWTRIHPPSNRLQRSPSQANSLSTTVPTSLVTRPLGGRHTPTRNSLRHSRMVVMNRTTKSPNQYEWTSMMTKVISLVVSAQIFVGGVGVVLAIWLTLWAPCIDFKEVPHYAGIPVFLSGLLGAIFLIYYPKLKPRNFIAFKVTVVSLCIISIVACGSLCVFTSMHLIRLAPTTCYVERLIDKKALPIDAEASFVYPFNEVEAFGIDPALRKVDKLLEGSGEGSDDEDYDEITPRFSARQFSFNRTRCVCEYSSMKTIYNDLSCMEVKNILPIIFVASCFVTFVGAVLSVMIIYIFWSLKYNPYQRAKPSEMRPFIFKYKMNDKNSNDLYR